MDTGLSMTPFRISPRHRFRGHRHRRLHLCVVLDGDFEERRQQTGERCRPGSVRLSQPGAGHDIDFGTQGAHCLMIELHASRFVRSDRPWRALEANAFCHHPSFHELARRIHESEYPDERYILELLAGAAHTIRSGAPPEAPDWLPQVRRTLDASFRSPVDITDLAEQAGIHRVHLSRTFFRHYGCAPTEYIRLRRIAHARRALHETEAPIAAIAFEAGFADQSHLTRTLHNYLRTTPYALRRAHREK